MSPSNTRRTKARRSFLRRGIGSAGAGDGCHGDCFACRRHRVLSLRNCGARSASCHLSNQPIPRRAVGIVKAKMAKWSLWSVG